MLLRAAAAGQRFYLLVAVIFRVAQANPAIDASMGMVLYRAAALGPRNSGGHNVLAAHKRRTRFAIGTCVPKVLATAGFISKVYAPEAAQ